MAKQKEIKMVPLNLIEPDINQPRKNFNDIRLGELISSIKKHGIMSPLTVEQQKGGLYILVDGERRYRASKEIGLKEVPVIVTEQQDEVSRLIQQFHLQEQHEGWSSLEKAVAVASLSDTLKVPISALGEMLSIPTNTLGEYVSFSKLLERKHFEKSEIPTRYAISITRLKEHLKRTYVRTLDKEFPLEDQRKLERAIIDNVKAGKIESIGDLTNLYDAVKVNPDCVYDFIGGKSIDKIYTESKAKVARHFINILNNARAISSHSKYGMELGMKKFFVDDAPSQKIVNDAIKNLKVVADTF